MYFTNSTGFNFEFVKEKKDVIIQANRADSDVRTSGYGGHVHRTDHKLQKLVRMAVMAYNTDGLIKQTVDKYAEMFKDFNFEGDEPKAIKYLENRLMQMSLQNGEYWKTTFARIICEYFKCGNAFVVKCRGYNNQSSQRALYKNAPFAISSLVVFPAEKLQPHYNTENKLDGWELTEWEKVPNMKITNPNGLRLGGWLIDVQPHRTEDKVFQKDVELIQIAYKKGAGANWGMGITLAGIEDISLLRTIELSTAVMIKKFSSPLIHHKIERGPSALSGTQNEIREAYQMYNRSSSDSIIITGGHHDIKTVGSESQAMRVEGYLKYFSNRGSVGVGMSPFLLGLESGSLGTAQTGVEELLKKIRFCQNDLNEQFKFYLLNEILWEGGFDPYNNPKHVVNMVFDEVDVDLNIKREAHAADMFTKNAIDHDELSNRINTKKKPNEGKLYVNMVDKKKEQFKADKRTQKGKNTHPSNRKKEYVKHSLLNILPSNEEELNEFLEYISDVYPEKENEFWDAGETLNYLLDDPEAFLEYTSSIVLKEDTNG